MIHVLTVHWRDDAWVDIQLKYFEKHLRAPYKTYAFLSYLPQIHKSKYFYASYEKIKSHGSKLNILADMAALHSTDENDWLMFIDGDAFPIGDIVEYGKEKLRHFPLIAIRRDENFGDRQPHPSFCLTTIKFWKEIEGDWRVGATWINDLGEEKRDVGGNVLASLNERGYNWHPMLRSNTMNLHALWFGIYDNIIYHHGAGFRPQISYYDRKTRGISKTFNDLHMRYLSKLPGFVNNNFNPITRYINENARLSGQVYSEILSNDLFYTRFQ